MQNRTCACMSVHPVRAARALRRILAPLVVPPLDGSSAQTEPSCSLRSSQSWSPCRTRGTSSWSRRGASARSASLVGPRTTTGTSRAAPCRRAQHPRRRAQRRRSATHLDARPQPASTAVNWAGPGPPPPPRPAPTAAPVPRDPATRGGPPRPHVSGRAAALLDGGDWSEEHVRLVTTARFDRSMRGHVSDARWRRLLRGVGVTMRRGPLTSACFPRARHLPQGVHAALSPVRPEPVVVVDAGVVRPVIDQCGE